MLSTAQIVSTSKLLETGAGDWASGLSSSIALAQATPGSVLNVVQKMTGAEVLTLNETVLAPFNVVPVLVLMILIPILYWSLPSAP